VPSMSVAKSHISNVPHVGHAYLHAASPRKSVSATERHSGQTASDILFSSMTPPRFGKQFWGGAPRRETHPSGRETYRFFTARSVSRGPWVLLCSQSPITRSSPGARRFRGRISRSASDLPALRI
jgi:hypothetical protein